VITWALVGVVVAAYILFVVWRFRAERRKKEAEEAAQAPMRAALHSPDLGAPSASPSPPVAAAPSTAPVAAAASAARAEPSALVATKPAEAAPEAAPGGSPRVTTVAAALAGIRLPADLSPLTTMTPRVAVGDRVAFWTNTVPAEIVGPAFADELVRLGFDVETTDVSTLHAERDDAQLTVVLHPEGLLATIDDQPAFPSLPERAVVVEIWLPE
jgi:hypothetical protein